MENFWHPIAISDEVTEDPNQFVLLGEKIVVFRDQSGVVALRDLCIHRGAALSGGKVSNGRITCPYHGWTYDRTGACVHIPSLPEGSTIPQKARALAYRTCEAFGLCWVAMRDPVQPFPEWPDDAWSNSDYRVFLVNTYLWKTSAGRAIENAMDFSHFNFVHAGYTELADGPIIKPYDVERTDVGLAFIYEDGRIRREYSLTFPFVLHDKKKVIAVNRGRTWSETGNTREGDATILSFIASPIDEKTTRLYVFMARNHSFDTEDSSFVNGFDIVTEQDRIIVEGQRPEQIPTDIKEELHLKFPDGPAIMYRRMLRELDNVEGYAP
jgi:phenylpropionate dioxygenase-like ring-hydroxylating dioxygenase large terminal subunit